MRKPFLYIDLAIEKMSSILLVVSLALILILSLQGIVLRWFDVSFAQVSPFIRHLVFLSTFLGGVIATGRKNHIGIDILTKILESKDVKNISINIGRVINLVSCSTLIWLIFAAVSFVQMEAEYGKVEFFGIHSKFLVAIIPFGLSLICYRFFFLFIDSFFQGERHV